MTAPFGICLVGAGRAGIVHATNLRRHVSGAEPVAVVDGDRERAAAVAAEVGGAPFGSLEEALGSGTRIDAAVIATPTFTHRDLAVEALGAGLHVFCEKPMALTAQECDEMIAAAERAGRVLQIGYVRRFQPEFVEASARIESGEIGDVMLVKSLTRGPGLPPPWAHDLTLSNGMLAEVNSHCFDSVRWLAGADIVRVYAEVANRKGARLGVTAEHFYDNAVVSLRFANDAIGSIDGVCPAEYGYDGRVEVEMRIYGGSSTISEASMNAVATRSDTLPASATLAERRALFDRMTNELMNVLNSQRRTAVLDTVRNETSVAAVAAARPGAIGGFPALAEGANKSTSTFQFASPEYFGVLGIDIVRGRGFMETERGAEETVAIVSESTARELWPGLDAIGQVVHVATDPELPAALELGPVPAFSRSLVVVGVARDVPGFRLGGFRISGAGIYVPTSAEADGTGLLLRMQGDAERAQFALVDRLAAIDPNMAQVSSLRTFALAESYILGIPFWFTLVLGALALFLTLSGLFSVLSYVVEQRMREFGVRSALGATRARIGLLVLSQSARPVGIGILIGAGLTAGFAGLLLATPGAEGIASTVRPLDPLPYAAAVLSVVAACVCAALVPALRAGRIDPVVALRQD